MATPYISLLSKRSISEQLQRHYDQSNIIYNIEDIVNRQTEDYNQLLKEVSKEQSEIMKAATSAICGKLEEGFALVSEGLDGIENAIYQLTDTLDTHLKMMINEQRYNNILSENIALLLKVSDSEKERQANILKGLKFFNDSMRDPSFFEVALKFFKKAEGFDDTDYLVHDKIGLIYLSSKDHKNYDEAIKYFTKAIKFSRVDTDPSSIRLANILIGDISRPLNSQNITIDYIKYLTSQSMLWISIAYYEQGKFAEAIKFAKDAFLLSPSHLDSGFALAKSLAASTQNTEAAVVLESIIKKNRNYSLKTLSDYDLAPKREILNVLEKLRIEALGEASHRVYNCKQNILADSLGKDLVIRIERLTDHESFLACMKAIDLLNMKNNYSFKEGIKKNESGKWEPIIKPMTFSFTLEELIDYEILLSRYQNNVRHLIEAKKKESDLMFRLEMARVNIGSASKELKENNKMTESIGMFVVGGIVAFFVGLIMLYTNDGYGEGTGVGWLFKGLIGLILLLGGLFLGGMGILGLIESGVKGINSSSKVGKISNEEKDLRNQIEKIKEKIKNLENS